MSTDRRRAYAAGIVLLGGLLLAGCPGTLKDEARFLTGSGGGGAAACPDVPTQLFPSSCGIAGCHAPPTAAEGLDLVSPGVAARVVGVAAMECAGILADPSDPTGSMIYRKIEGPPPCGALMPLGQPMLSASDIACVETWIAGAGQMGSTGGGGGAVDGG
jgi:hypothetical protein